MAAGPVVSGEPRIKTCVQCRKTKAISSFGILRARRDGHSGICLDCRRRNDAVYRQTDKCRKQRTAYKKGNGIFVIRAAGLRYYHKNKEGINARRRTWRGRLLCRRHKLLLRMREKNRDEGLKARQRMYLDWLNHQLRSVTYEC